MSKKMNWDAEADRKLLLTILRVNSVKIDTDAVAAELSEEFSTTITAIAVKRRLDRLREMSGSTKAANIENGTKRKADEDGDGGIDAAKTKRGRKKGVAVSTKGKAKKQDVDDDDDDDDKSLIKDEFEEDA